MRRIAKEGERGRWRWQALVGGRAVAYGPVTGFLTRRDALQAAARYANPRLRWLGGWIAAGAVVGAAAGYALGVLL